MTHTNMMKLDTCNMNNTEANVYSRMRELQHAFNDDLKYYLHGTTLRSCTATVYRDDGNDVVYLVSYNTLVAIIDHKNGAIYDILRIAYGYTATSAQHISKFVNDYAYSCYLLYRFI